VCSSDLSRIFTFAQQNAERIHIPFLESKKV